MKLRFFSICFIGAIVSSLLYGQPSSVDPLGGATGALVGTDVTWQSFSDGTGSPDAGPYTLKFYTDAGHLTQLGSSITGILSGGANTTVLNSAVLSALSLVGNLDYNTQYFWGVQDEDDGIEYFYSFTTEIATPVLVGPGGFPIATTDVALNPTFQWSMEGNTAGITYELTYQLNSVPQPDITGLASTTYNGLTFNRSALVIWGVKAKKGAEETVSNGFVFSTIQPIVSLSVNNTTLSESGGTNSADFTLELDGIADVDVGVQMVFSGTAAYPNLPFSLNFDYQLSGTSTAPPYPFIISAGDLSTTFTLTVDDDAFLEAQETIIADIHLVANGSEDGVQQENLTIDSDEKVKISKSILVPIDEDTPGLAMLTVEVVDGSGAAGTVDPYHLGSIDVIIDYSSTAIYNTDYTTFSGINPEVLSIPAGSPFSFTQLVTIPDDILEGNEVATATITNTSVGVNIISATENSVDITITDNEEVTLAAPLNGQTGLSLAPLLSWENMDGATQYTLEVYEDDGVGNPGASVFNKTDIVHVPAVPSQVYTLTDPDTPIEDNTTYHWRVRGEVNPPGGIYSEYSSPYWTFSTLQHSLISPPDGVANIALDPSRQLTLSWDDMHTATGADNYILRVGSSPGASDIVSNIDKGTSTSHIVTLDYNTNYYWGVTAQNKSSAEWSFRTELPEPFLTVPANGTQTVDKQPVVSWTIDPNTNTTGMTYDFAYFYNGNPTSEILGVTSGVTPFAGPQGLGQYEWDIRINDGAGLGGSFNPDKRSSNGNFIFDIVPGLDSPVNGLTGVSILPFVTWDEGNVSDYWIEISTDPAFGSFVVQKNVLSSTEAYQFLETDAGMPLNNSTVYYWRVRFTSGGVTLYSEEWHFTTIPKVNVTVGHPANGMTVQTTVTPFSWYISQGQGGLTFWYQISQQDAEPTPTEWAALPVAPAPVPQQYEVTTLSTTFTLLGGTKYWWRVIVLTNGGTEVVSYMTHAYVITDGGATNVTPTPTWPTNGTQLYTNTPQFGWTVMGPGIDLTYDLVVDLDGIDLSGDEIVLAPVSTNINGLSYTPTSGLNYGHTYYWYVRAVYKRGTGDEVVGSYCTPQLFTIVGGANVTLYPSWPIGGANANTVAPRLYWYLSTYVTGVTYQICIVSEGNNATGSVDGAGKLLNGVLAPVAPASFSSNLYYDLFGLSPGEKYYWQVRPYNTSNSEYGDWSVAASFITNGSGTLVKPIPSYPVGLTIYTLAPKLYWYLGADGTGLVFDIYYREQGAGGWTGPAHGLAALNYQMPTLKAGTIYEWKVVSRNAVPATMESDVVTFTTAGGITGGYPVATWPIGNPTMYTPKPAMSWYLEGSSIGLTGYILKYSTSVPPGGWAGFSGGAPGAISGEVSIPGISTTSWTATADLTYGQTYYWAVASTDGSAPSAYSQGSFTIVGGATEGVPILSWPTNGWPVIGTSVALSWYHVTSTAGITGYEIMYSRSDVFAIGNDAHGAVTVTVTQGATQSYTINPLIPGATYFWKVRSLYGAGPHSNWSNVFEFDVATSNAPIQPKIGGPANSVVVTTSAPTLSWIINSDNVNVLTYELEISENEDLNNFQNYQSVGDPFVGVSGLEAGKDYYWRVRSRLDDEYSGYSGVGKFKTDNNITTIEIEEEVIPEQFTVAQNYPNPFNPSTVIKYEIPENALISIKIYNILGKEIAILVNDSKNAGTYETIWNGTDHLGNKVSSGTYIFRVTAGNNVVTKKMLLLK